MGTGTPISYVYDINAALPLVLNDGTRKYVYGFGLAYAVDQTGTLLVTHADGLGSVRAITDGTGSITKTFQTDEFGITLLTQGTSPEPFRFTGQEWDAESGFYNLRARFYAPALGRFVSRDAFAGLTASPLSLNRSSYAGNNPVNFDDPSGLEISRILKGGDAPDSQCFTTLGGKLDFYMVNPACLGYQFQDDQNPDSVELAAVSGIRLPTEIGVVAAFAPDDKVSDIMRGKKGSIRHAPLDSGSPGWDDIVRMTWKEIEKGAKEGLPGFRTIRKLLTNSRFNR